MLVLKEMSVYWDSTSSNGKIKSTPVLFGNMLSIETLGNTLKLNSGPFYDAPVSAVTTGSLPSYTVTGNTITKNTNGTIAANANVFDDVILIHGSRVLVTTEGANNGVYEVSSTGSLTLPWELTRIANTMPAGYAVFVTSGTTYTSTSFIRTGETGAIVFVQFSAVQTYTGANVGATGMNVFDSVVGTTFQYNKIAGSASVNITQPGGPGTSLEVSVNATALSHNDLLDLSNDVHNIYPLMTGRTGGQEITGGNGSGEVLRLSSTSHPTKGYIYIPEQTNSFDTESGALIVGGGVGIDKNLSVGGNINVIGNIIMQPFATVDSVDISALNAIVQGFVGDTFGSGLNSLTPSVVAQISHIGSNTIEAITWGYLSTVNQNVSTISNVTFANVTGTIATANQPSINHNSLANLTSGDPHTQYVFLAGRGGGQVVTGGTGAGNSLDFISTTNATKGAVRVLDTKNSTNYDNGAFTVAGGVGVGRDLHVFGSGYFGTNLTVTGQLINGVHLVDLKTNFDGLATNLYTTAQLTNSILTNAISTLAGVTITNPQWQAVANSNGANGVVTTDVFNKISVTQLPTGVSASTVALGNHTHDFRKTGTISSNTNRGAYFSIPELSDTFGTFRVYIYASVGNGPSAIFDICKSNIVANAGGVTRAVSQVVAGAELSMVWAASIAPQIYHSSTSVGSNPVTYTYTIAN